MPTARNIDRNGFLLVKGCPLSSFGIFDYSAGQLGLPGDPMRIVKVFRPESAVSDPSAIASFKDVPLINDHVMLSGFQGDQENTAPEDYGTSGHLTSNVYYDAPWMRGDIKVFSRSMQRALAKGKKDLSLGYDCDFEEKPGVWNGQPYEVVQTNLRGNHIALVQEGRVPGARVLDGMCFDHLSFDIIPSDKENTMPKPVQAMDKAARDSAVAELQKLVPALSNALQQFLTEEGAEPAHQEPAVADPAAPDPVAADPVTDPATEPGATDVTDPNDDVASQIEGAADPVATDPAAADPAMADPAAAEGGGLQALIAEAKAVLEKLAALAAPAAEPNEPTADTVEGLQETSPVEGAQVSTDAADPSAPSDPSKDPSSLPGAGKAQDAAIRGFYADLAAKDSLYQRLSAVVGTFDHKAMDSRQVVAYGVKKLGIKCADGMEKFAVEAYLAGAEKARAATRTSIATSAADSAPATTVEMDQYLQGSN
jgi:hypothetical protein